MQETFLEKRRHPRLEKQIPLKIQKEGFDIAAESRNISSSGVYFNVKNQIEPMTKLKVELILPIKKDLETITKIIKCSGVVVRTEKENDTSYNIAVYFSHISEADTKKIAEYVNQHISANAA